MSDQPAEPGAAPIDPAFFVAVNEFVELANRQGRANGPRRTSFAALYGVARYNCHTYLATEPKVADNRTGFLDYMTELYRRMLNEHLDKLGEERGIDVGVSELAGEGAGQTLQVDEIPGRDGRAG